MTNGPTAPTPHHPSTGRRWWTAGGLVTVTGLLVLAGTLGTTAPAYAAAPVGLGTVGTYSVLGGQTVTNTGPSVLAGDLGVSPGTAITGFPPGIVGGATHAGDAQAAQAQSDLVIAYNDAAGRAPTASIAGDLVGQTLTGGVYNSSGPIGLSGTLTLDGQGDLNSVFIFQVASTLITATASSVSMINGAQACNVYWQVGSSATLGTTSVFNGTIMALTSITVTTGTVVHGRALARNGQVSLDTNVFTNDACEAGPTTSPTTTTTTSTTSPTTTTTTGTTTTTTDSTTTTGTSTTTTPTNTTTTGTGTATSTSSGTGVTRSSVRRTSAAGGGAGGARSTGSGLADTGPGRELSPLAGLGALLVLVGILVIVTGRTRRA